MRISRSLCFVAAGLILSSISVSSLTPYFSRDRARLTECFVAGTQILMADGSSENIEDIQPGDLVLSYNTVTRQFENRAVTTVLTVQPLQEGDTVYKTPDSESLSPLKITTILLNYERRFK